MILPPKELLSELVRIPSVFPSEADISAHMEKLLTTLGFSITRVMTEGSRPSLVATFGTATSYLGFYGHLDTVPPAADYQRDPFNVVVDGDIARGLGVVDMKGGNVCILHLAAYAAAQNLPVKIIFGVDEEDISRGAHDLVNSGLLNDLAFLVVAESGQVQDYSLPFSVCLGRKGRIVFTVQIKGKAAHAADSKKGINAIEVACAYAKRLSEINFAPHPTLGSTRLILQHIEAHANAFSVPDSCHLSFSLLTSPYDTTASFLKTAHDIAADLGADVQVSVASRPTPYGESYELVTNSGFAKILLSDVLLPAGAKPMYTSSVADENVFANRLKIPVISIGPTGDGDHTKDEWVSLSSLSNVIQMYKKCLDTFLAHSQTK
jgi:acetylornithine deacetylase/succinyl-diaminopimelate desuccinylase-like protein